MARVYERWSSLAPVLYAHAKQPASASTGNPVAAVVGELAQAPPRLGSEIQELAVESLQCRLPNQRRHPFRQDEPPGGSKTKSGNGRDSAQVLEVPAAMGHELPRKISFDWRKLTKLKST